MFDDWLHRTTNIQIVFELHSSRAVQLNVFQCLADNIVRLFLRLLRGLDHSRLIQIALVVDIQLPESVLQREEVTLLELRELPATRQSAPANQQRETQRAKVSILLEFQDVHCRRAECAEMLRREGLRQRSGIEVDDAEVGLHNCSAD